MMQPEIKKLALKAKGFLAEPEGLRLFELAQESSLRAPCLEIGTYCGKSTLFLGEGCRQSRCYPLFTVDHHRGSEEQQVGQLYFDPDLFDPDQGGPNTLPVLIRNLRQAGLVDWVIPVIADSRLLGRCWPNADISLLFIDGGHSEAAVSHDYEVWSPRVIPGGYLCMHDIFADPALGGQAPFHVFEKARQSGSWEFVDQIMTLGIMRRR